MSRFPYKALDNFVLRTPTKSFTFLKEFLSEKYVSEEESKKVYSDLFFQEALFLASPNLYSLLKDWLEGKITDKKKTDKLKLSLLKYLSRMSTRCTPFGLFAGYSLGKFNNNTNISLDQTAFYKRSTRLDMQYLVMLSQNLTNIESIRNTLLFTKNTSLYKIGNQSRYIEYKYSRDFKRTHHIEAIENDEYFEYIINKVEKGKTIKNLTHDLINLDSEISVEEANEYINTLIDNQILVSKIDPVVIGKDYFQIIKSSLNSKKILSILDKIDNSLKSIDTQIPNPVEKYYKIKSITESLNTDIDLKYFFQTDLNIGTKVNTIEKKLLKDIKEGITFLNKLSLISKNSSVTYLEIFIKKFKLRYENQIIPLVKALDPESGIGYKNNDITNIVPDNTFIDNLIIPSKASDRNEITWTNVNRILQYKITQAYKNGDYTIKFNTNDLPDSIEEIWDDLPDTFSLLTEIVKIDGQQKIKIDGAYGASGANLFGRFCFNDNELFDHTQKIINIETKINSDLIIAEISHLPESRLGNVICRPSFSEYEIPYLSNSIKPLDNQILISDLMISVKENKIILFSKKLKKRILPRLINSHNYSSNTTPIYHFLSDLQNQGKRHGLGLDLGPITKNYNFIPRIEFNNLILKPATWNLRKKDMEIFTENPKSDYHLLEAASATRTRWEMPQYILLAENDNELFINLENIDSIKMMIDTIGEKTSFTFKEFLFTDNDQLVQKDGESYTNQIIVTFYNNQKLSSIKDD
ncbi:lantibiotic dehydratase family protein [Chryseobacterium oranimense]|uniref:lantibiotic dehydratase family protein n=1 Tax=Chryseobacterium oranimense TaxID=421058 RepID=UPI0031D2B149